MSIRFNQLCTIHGDLEFNHFEEEIIRHPSFNRLAEIRQLGYAYKGAYKCASHTRLSHSLGTCYLAKKILKSAIEKTKLLKKEIKENGKSPFPNDKELKEIKSLETLLGVAALVHDINHTPFAHTIQSHLALSEEIIQSEELFERNINSFEHCVYFDKKLKSDTKRIFSKSKHRKLKHDKLLYDIIRGDLGASSIDFIARDHYHVGFGQLILDKPDQRFVLIKHQGQIEIALDLTQNNLSFEMVYNLLFNRYKLARRVYFHKTCSFAEAMIGKALRRILKLEESGNNGNLLKKFLEENNTDSEFYSGLVNSQDSMISYLGVRLHRRQLFNEAYIYQPPTTEDDDLKNHLCQTYTGVHNFNNCIDLEHAIADEFGLNEKEVAVFCYNSSMYGFKISDTLVLDKHLKVKTISDLPSEPYIEYESIKMLKRLHRNLWKFYILCGEKNPTLLKRINNRCKDIFKSKTSLKSFLTKYSRIRKKQLSDSTNQLKIFLSYSWADVKEAKRFFDKIKAWRFDIFMDREKEPAESWTNELEKNLKGCDLVIVLWSDNSSKSEWVDKEIAYSQALNKKLLIFGLDETPAKLLIANKEIIKFRKRSDKFWQETKKKLDTILQLKI